MIYVALFFAFLDGFGQPVFGVFFSKIMNILLEPLTPENEEDVISKTRLYCLAIFLIGLMMFISLGTSKYAWGILGENVTLAIRKELYEGILRKHIGFHDFRENGSSVLTSSMAQDSSIVNGVSTESIGPMVDGMSALIVGLAIGFFFSWKMSLICLAISPLLMLGAYLDMKAQAGQATV